MTDTLSTTTTHGSITKLSLEDMLEAAKFIEPVPQFALEVSKKGKALLEKELPKITPFQCGMYDQDMIFGSLYGIEVRVRPYLKKAKLYIKK